jgi:hypothetical protein
MRSAAGLQPTAMATVTEGDAWLVSPAVDLALFVAVTLTTIAPWIAADHLHVPGYYVLVGVAFANGPHLISTWTRVYLPRRERFRRPLHYWVVPGIAAAFAIGCMVLGGWGPIYLRTVIFYWASWHFAAQSYGILRLYQRKHGVIGTRAAHLEKALIFLPALFFVMHRLFTGPWELFGVIVIHPRLPPWSVNAVGALTLTVAALYLVELTRTRVHWLRPVYLASNAFGFCMPYLVIKTGTAAFAAAALWHAIQYIGIVWLHNRRRYAGRIDPDARIIAWVSQPGRSLWYVLVIAACAAGVYSVALIASAFSWSLQEWSLTLWTGLTLGHYYLDGVIWKFKQYDLQTLAPG